VPSWTRWLAVGWTLLTLAWPLFPDVPFNPSDPYSMSSGWRPVIAAWYLGSASAPRPYRYARASGPVERQQTEWVVYGVTVAVLGWTAYTRAPDILPVLERPGMTRVLYRLVGGPIFACALLPIPLSLMVAILRYRPFDIDVVVNRTLVYGSLTAVLALVYLGSVVLLQGTFLALTGQESQLAVVASTLMIAALFNPLRHRVQALVDRRFYRRNYDAAKTLQEFSTRLGHETNLDRVGDELVGVVRETMQPTHVSLRGGVRRSLDRRRTTFPGAGRRRGATRRDRCRSSCLCRTRPPPRRRCGRSEPARAGGAQACGRGADQRSSRRKALREPPHGKRPPQLHLPQAGGRIAQRSAALRLRTRSRLNLPLSCR
jgi:hypothetical protein